MIEFRALGSAELLNADGAPVGSVLAQPKRLALLAWLVTARPRGFHRRDTLLAIFWPESDSERARAALRQAVRFLRRSLGEAVLVNRGEDEIGIAPGTIRCDVVAFDQAVDAGDDAAALDLFRGELLAGLFIDDAPEWEQWLDGERLRLRERAAACAARLADAAADRGDRAAAVSYARRACDLAPSDEAAVRRLLTALDRSGDRAGAVAAYERYADWLAAELELEPAPETQELAASIRIRDRAVVDVTAGAGSTADPTDAQMAAGPAADSMAVPVGPIPRAPGRGRGHHAGRLAVPAAALLLLAVATWVAWPARGAATLQEDRFLVAPFENLTGDSALDAVGRMTADRVIQGLTDMGSVEVMPLTTLLSAAARPEPGAAATADAMRDLAREVGAGRLVSGSYYLQGDQLLFQARISDVRSGGVLRALDVVAAPADSPLVAVELLRTRVRAALAPMLDQESHARAGAPPPTYEAYRDYVAGMEAFMRLDMEAALAFMERAAAADTTYAMPLIVTAIMHMNLGNWAAADSVTSRVRPYRDRLGPMEMAIFDMIAAWVRGDDVAAYDAVRRQHALAPGTIAHYQMAEQARRLNRPREALRILRELAPRGAEPVGELRGWRTYWRELAWSYHMLGDHRAELREARRARALYPDDAAVLLHEARALAALGRVDAVERVVQLRLSAPVNPAPSPAVFMRVAGLELMAHGREDAGRRLLERSADWYAARPAQERPAYRHALARGLYDVGRFDESRAIYTELLDEAPDDLTARAYVGLMAAATGDEAAARDVSDWLADLERPYLFGLNTYLRARIAARLGEPAEAARLVREAMGSGFRYNPDLHVEPEFQPMRRHPAFRALLSPAG